MRAVLLFVHPLLPAAVPRRAPCHSEVPVFIAAAAFLLGPDATFITETDALIDGGVTAAVQTSVSAVPG